MSIAYFNGEFLNLEDVRVSPLDRGYLFGDGVYEVIPVYAGNLFRFDGHLDRLERSMTGISLDNPYSREQWRETLEDLVARNNGGNQSIYFQVTRGVAPRNHAFPEDVQPSVFMMSNEVHEHELKPLKALTRVDNRWGRCDIKAIALLANCLHKQAAIEGGAGEAILLRDGMLTEGSSTNVFVVKHGKVFTPPKSEKILAGITRDVAIELMHAAQIPVHEADVTQSELQDADEIWVTSSSVEVAPVVNVDDRQVGSGEPGPVWSRVNDLMQDYKRSLLTA